MEMYRCLWLVVSSSLNQISQFFVSCIIYNISGLGSSLFEQELPLKTTWTTRAKMVSPPCLTFMQFVPISESLMNNWNYKGQGKSCIRWLLLWYNFHRYKMIRFANHAVLKFLFYSYIHLFGIIIINDKSRKPLRIIQWNFANHY